MVISPYHHPAGRRAWLPVLGPLLLAGTLAAGCSASSTPVPSTSGSSNSGSNASFRQCLQRQGVSLPQGRPSPGSGQPQARPAGSAASSFRKALKACGGGSFPRGGPPPGNAAGHAAG
jgi:hypothetical protein